AGDGDGVAHRHRGRGQAGGGKAGNGDRTTDGDVAHGDGDALQGRQAVGIQRHGAGDGLDGGLVIIKNDQRAGGGKPGGGGVQRDACVHASHHGSGDAGKVVHRSPHLRRHDKKELIGINVEAGKGHHIGRGAIDVVGDNLLHGFI
ncbi:MAG: hypothetical protein EBZ61_11290, partial [Micrococcales bacterium]|nr:hypothetical protein [Micrococcales bacterium]